MKQIIEFLDRLDKFETKSLSDSTKTEDEG